MAMDDEQGDQAAERIGPRVSDRGTVMLVGSAAPDELVLALQRLGAEVIVVDRHAGNGGLADEFVSADIADADELSATIRRVRPRSVLIASDRVAIDALDSAAATGVEVVPGVRSTALIADLERLRRLAADELGLPTVPFWFAGSVDELRSIAEHAGFPMVVRPVAAPPGEGRSVLLRADDVEPAWQYALHASDDAASPRVLAETVVEFDHQVTLLTVHTDGPAEPVLEFCAPIGHRSIEGPNGRPVLEAWQPQAISAPAADAAKSIAARVVRAIDGRGLFGVELLVRGNEVYYAGVTARPYDVGLLTLRTQRLSAFELQARAVLGLPVDALVVSPGAARLTYATRAASDLPTPVRPDIAAGLAGALDIAESDVVVFADHHGHPRQRLGVALATASEVVIARSRAEQVSAELDKLWSDN